MGMSNAERQRKFCSRWDEDETRRKYLQDSKEKYKKDKTLGKRKQITDMTQREKRHQRKIWRVQKRKLKERRKAEQERILTPPSSPVTPEKRQKRQIDDKQMDPYDRKKEFKTYLQKLAKCRTFCELQTECKQINDTIEMGTANEIRKADGTECTFKEFMESSVDSLNIGIGKVDGANNGTESDSKDTSSKVNGSNGGTDSDSKDVDEKLDGGNGGTGGDKTDDDAKVDGSNGGTDSDKTDDDPKIDGAKEGTDGDSKDADVKVDGSNGGTESYSKDAVANDDREQHETEHVNTDLNDHEGVSMGEKHRNKISDIDTNFDTCIYKEKHVLVNFNGKAHVGIVRDKLVICISRLYAPKW
ncbi:dentin sialophosphoprotein-like [Mya arenaria]|uniref:dentin sialophosphoprotein-like n=1 Tax=Mya arenaria TaxID=6604 RepID=UPI0022E05CC6|nr:dentin sialophosphoprotein-like [Mya arenaria]